MARELSARKVVSIGVDWITLTQSRLMKGPRVELAAASLLHSEKSYGNILRPWSMSGYNGFHCGRLQVGSRADGSIIRLSSTLANQRWWEFSRLTDACSRIDFQVTARDTRAPAHWISRHFREASRDRRRHNEKFTVSLFKSSDGSATLYLGKRVSEKYGRVYDKEKESSQPAWVNCVRYELELKGAAASHALDHLTALKRSVVFESHGRQMGLHASIADSIDAYIAGRCLQWFHKHGVRSGLAWQPQLENSSPDPRCDWEIRLAWVRSSLRGTTELARSQRKIHEYCEALGLTESDIVVLIADHASV